MIKTKRYKMFNKMRLILSLKIWIAIYPSISLFLYYFGSTITPLPLLLRTFVLTIVLVPWVVFFAVPLIDYLLKQITILIQNK